MNNLIKMAMLHNWVNNSVARCNRARANSNSKALPVREKVEYCDQHNNRFFRFIEGIYASLIKSFKGKIL